MALHALLLKRHMLFKKMGMTQGDGTYLEGDLALEGTGEDWKLDVEWHMPCSHQRMMGLAYGVWGHSLAYKESKEPENFQGAS
ncbi:hypothetical protein POTOM_048172 [Populus tomentosa]|uniref:Uncharacterized protein n=1 Tax=Populus tomentosa TaxID=118781 RepID=A0A8X7YCL7_POPTO|nr:hypothetical protein POTOM_048172 [Populus tomentosa]